MIYFILKLRKCQWNFKGFMLVIFKFSYYLSSTIRYFKYKFLSVSINIKKYLPHFIQNVEGKVIVL